MNKNEPENNNQISEKIITLGKYKLPGVIGFKSLYGQYVINAEEAHIPGRCFSGMMSHLLFKLTIRDNQTVDFDEVLTTETDEKTRGRLLEKFSEHEPIVGKLGGMHNPSIFTFTSTIESQLSNKVVALVLLTEYRSPIDKLGDISNDDSNKISDLGLSNLNDWLSEIGVVSTKKNDIVVIDDQDEEVKDVNVQLKDSEFNKFKVSKEKLIDTGLIYKDELGQTILHSNEIVLIELKKRLTNKEITVTDFENKIIKINDEINDLNNRITSIENIIQPNGLLFSVSERIYSNEFTFTNDVIDAIRSKIENIRSIKTDAFMDMFRSNKYFIYIGDPNGEFFSGDLESIKLPKDTIFEDNKFIYLGDNQWHTIVADMIKLGYSQNAKFDEKAGSNSYHVKGESILPIEGNLTDVMIKDKPKGKSIKDYISDIVSRLFKK